MLSKKRTVIALHWKERARFVFLKLEQFKQQSLVNSSLDNDRVWESVDDATK